MCGIATTRSRVCAQLFSRSRTRITRYARSPRRAESSVAAFHRWPEAEFDRRWRTHIGRSTHLSRAQMEEYANLWQLAEQIRRRVSLACDAQTTQSGPCRGWNEFSNADIARFCSNVLGESVEVIE